MSIADNYAPTKVQGNGATVAFTFDWNMIAVTNGVIIFENVATGVQTIQSTGFTITLDSDGSGGAVTFVTPPPNTVYVIISRDVPASQETTYQTSSGFQAKVVEDSLDSSIAVIQQEKDAIDRSPKTKVGGTQNLTFPEPEANKAVGWNPAGTDLENKVSPEEAVDEAAASADEAAASATAAENSASTASASETAAADSATAASNSAAGVNLPDIEAGDAEKQLVVNSGETGYDLKRIAISDIILRGFELSTFVADATSIVIESGVLIHGNTVITKTANTALVLDTAGNYYDGNLPDYSSEGWNYVGVDSNGNIKLLATNAPDVADVSGNTAGGLLYFDDTGGTSGEYWRVIGAIRTYENGGVISAKWGQLQTGKHIMLDIPQNLTTTVSAAAWTDGSTKAKGDCQTLIPAIATMGIFGLLSNQSAGQPCSAAIRPNGSTWSDASSTTQMENTVGNVHFGGGQRLCATDGSQKINYRNDTGDTSTSIDIEGYILNIR